MNVEGQGRTRFVCGRRKRKGRAIAHPSADRTFVFWRPIGVLSLGGAIAHPSADRTFVFWRAIGVLSVGGGSDVAVGALGRRGRWGGGDVGAFDEDAVVERGIEGLSARTGEPIAEDEVLWQAGGGIARKFQEDAVEVADGGKAARFGDFRHGAGVALKQKAHGVVRADIVEILREGRPRHCLEIAGEVGLAHAHEAHRVFKGVLGVARLDILQKPLERLFGAVVFQTVDKLFAAEDLEH